MVARGLLGLGEEGFVGDERKVLLEEEEGREVMGPTWR
jgi:hypothetical protein